MFLKRNGYTSIGGTLMICVSSLQWAILVNGFVASALTNFTLRTVTLDIRAMINALFSVVSVMISFGVVIGKLSTFEMIFASWFEIMFVAVNNWLGNGRGTVFQAVDIGGSIFIHMFGAYFGLAFAWALRSHHTKKQISKSTKGSQVSPGASTASPASPSETTSSLLVLSTHPNNTATVTSDLFAMVGTVFLFIYWPSFNAAFASILNNNNGPAQMRALINTMSAQVAGACSAFLFSRLFRRSREMMRGKFHMTDIQNATLAAGVAIGASADQVVTVAGAMVVGVLAAMVSVLGYVHVQGWLERYLHLSDTCGVNNLHGMPGLVGGFVSVWVTWMAPRYLAALGVATLDEWFPHGANQYLYQLIAIGVTMAVAIVGGWITAGLVHLARPILNSVPSQEDAFFTDEVEWFLPEPTEHTTVAGGVEGGPGKNQDTHTGPADLESQKSAEKQKDPAKSLSVSMKNKTAIMQ